MNIILPKVSNFDIKQKRHGILVLLYATNAKQYLGKQRPTKHNKFRSQQKWTTTTYLTTTISIKKRYHKTFQKCALMYSKWVVSSEKHILNKNLCMNNFWINHLLEALWMDDKFTFLLLFSKHLEHKAKYKRRRRVSNMILIKMLLEKNIYAHQNLVRPFIYQIRDGTGWLRGCLYEKKFPGYRPVNRVLRLAEMILIFVYMKSFVPVCNLS